MKTAKTSEQAARAHSGCARLILDATKSNQAAL